MCTNEILINLRHCLPRSRRPWHSRRTVPCLPISAGSCRKTALRHSGWRTPSPIHCFDCTKEWCTTCIWLLLFFNSEMWQIHHTNVKWSPPFVFFSAQYSIILMLKIHFYRPPMKLGESNVFTGVRLSTGGGGGGRSRGWVSLVPGPFREYPTYQVPWGGYACSQVPTRRWVCPGGWWCVVWRREGGMCEGVCPFMSRVVGMSRGWV